MYYITDYTKRKASENGYIIKPSTNKNKKIDVFIGDKNYIFLRFVISSLRR